jgi:hypothetical protein
MSKHGTLAGGHKTRCFQRFAAIRVTRKENAYASCTDTTLVISSIDVSPCARSSAE